MLLQIVVIWDLSDNLECLEVITYFLVFCICIQNSNFYLKYSLYNYGCIPYYEVTINVWHIL